jgi:2-haloacid dehalogenase
MDPRFAGIRACVFDAYGTLFDFASAAAGCADVLGDKVGALAALWRDKQLQYSWLRSLQGRYVPFRQVTADALDFTLTAMRLEDPALRLRLLGLYDRLEPFPEVPGVLARLADRGLRLAILSNGSPDMLAPLVDRPGLREHLGDVLSVDAVGVFKTGRAVYQHAVDRLGVAPAEICFFSSNGWDAWAASDFGMRVMWCNRTGQPRERLPGNPDAELRSLEQALSLLE